LSGFEEISKCQTEIPSDTSKSAENPGVEPVSDGLTDEKGGKPPSTHTNGEITEPPVETPLKAEGEEPAEKPVKKTMAETIRAIAADHPDWQPEKIAKVIKRSKSVVARALNGQAD
jgi:hypothetical protein